MRFLEKVIDLLELFGREVMEPLGADAGEIYGVEDGAEEPLVVGHLLRHLLEDADRLRPRRPLDDDHCIVVLSELGDVIDPQLVVVAARIEEIGAVDLVPQATRRPDPRQHRGDDGDGNDGPSGPKAEMGPGDERPPDQAWMGVARPGRPGSWGRSRSAIGGIVLAHAVVHLPWRGLRDRPVAPGEGDSRDSAQQGQPPIRVKSGHSGSLSRLSRLKGE